MQEPIKDLNEEGGDCFQNWKFSILTPSLHFSLLLLKTVQRKTTDAKSGIRHFGPTAPFAAMVMKLTKIDQRSMNDYTLCNVCLATSLLHAYVT